MKKQLFFLALALMTLVQFVNAQIACSTVTANNTTINAGSSTTLTVSTPTPLTGTAVSGTCFNQLNVSQGIGGSTVSYNQYIYQINDNNTIFQYNTLTGAIVQKTSNTITSLATIGAFSTTIIGDKIYVTGGYYGNSVMVNNVFCYDITNDSWTQKASFVHKRGMHSSVAINGKLYIFGGLDYTTFLNSGEVYDPATNAWTATSPMTQARERCGATVLNGKIYVLGGNNTYGYGFFNINECYDPTTNSWTTKASLPEQSDCERSVVTFQNEIWVFGGRTYTGGAQTQSHNLKKYNPTTNSWTIYCTNNLIGAGTGNIAMNNLVYQLSSPILIFNPLNVGTPTYQWSNGATTPSITVSPIQTTTYTVNTTGTGSTCSNSITINVNPTTVASCPTLSGTLTNGLVAYYPFCGNANDESGNNNNGTVNGATLTADRFGNANSAYSFNGLSNYIRTINPGPTGTNSRSVSVWVKTNSTSPGSILSYGNNDSSSQDFRILLNGLGITCGGNTVSDMSCTITGSGRGVNYIPNNSWDFFTFIYDVSVANNLTSVKIYINGILSSTYCDENISNSLNTGSTNPITIGRYHWLNYSGNNQYFSGSLDDISVWNRVLTDQEIATLYNANICYQSVTVTDTLIINTGILSYNPITYNNTVTIYPNPANDHITIDCGTLANVVGYSIKITNTLGQEVFNQPMNTQQYYVALNSWTGQGIYFVNIIDAQGHIIDVKKIILQ